MQVAGSTGCPECCLSSQPTVPSCQRSLVFTSSLGIVWRRLPFGTPSTVAIRWLARTAQGMQSIVRTRAPGGSSTLRENEREADSGLRVTLYPLHDGGMSGTSVRQVSELPQAHIASCPGCCSYLNPMGPQPDTKAAPPCCRRKRPVQATLWAARQASVRSACHGGRIL